MHNASLIVASVIHVSLRLAYFFYVGLTLKNRQEREKESTYNDWQRFKNKASLIINADGLTLGLLIILSAASLPVRMSVSWTLAIGIIMTCVGIGVKLAAYRVVGTKGYYWYNFFCGDQEREYATTGVYKYLDNPMYTIGYFHTFGVSLIFRSLWGFVFALFDWVMIWAFHFCFERPHTRVNRERVISLNPPRLECGSLGQEN